MVSITMSLFPTLILRGILWKVGPPLLTCIISALTTFLSSLCKKSVCIIKGMPISTMSAFKTILSSLCCQFSSPRIFTKAARFTTTAIDDCVVPKQGMTLMTESSVPRDRSLAASLLSLSCIGTNPTDTAVRIFICKLVTVYTMSLACVYCCWAIATKDVNFEEYKLDVHRIGTDRPLAKVIARQFLGYCPNEHSTSSDMSVANDPLDLETSVTTFGWYGSPQPTRSSVIGKLRVYANVAKEVFKEFQRGLNCARIGSNHLGLQLGLDGLGFRGLTHREALSL